MLTVFITMNFVLNMSASVFNGILDQLAIELNVSVSQSGLLNSLYSFGAGIGVPVFLLLCHKSDKTILLKKMLILDLVSSVLLVFTHSFIPLLAIRFLMGFAGNCYAVLATATIVSLSPSDKLGKYLSLMIAGSALAMIVGVPFVRAVSSLMSWQQIFIILIILMVLSLVYFIFNLKSDMSYAEMNIRDELNFLSKKQVQVILITSLFTFIGYGFQVYTTPYILTLYPEFESNMSLILVLIGISSFIGNMMGGIFCDRIGYRKAYTYGAILLAVTSSVLLFTQNYAIVNLILLIMWMGIAWFIGLQINTAINVVTEGKSKFMISLNSSTIQLGTALGSSIAAIIISSAGIQWIIIPAILASIITAIILVMNK